MPSSAPSQKVRAALGRLTGRTVTEGRSRAIKRERRRWRLSLAFALIFHLSMITIFEIVIVFPKEETVYYDVSIISAPMEATDAVSIAGRTGDALALSGSALFDSSLPLVELPVIEFAELERLRIRYDASAPPPALESLFGPTEPTDSWARFGGELKKLGRSLRALALPDDSSSKVPALSHRPAEGFEARVEWNTAPRDRELLFAPPIQALWRVRPEDLERPVEIVLKVDPNGRVTNVWSPQLDQGDLLEEIQMTVLQYRFAPLSHSIGESAPSSDIVPAREQSGVLIIQAARGAS